MMTSGLVFLGLLAFAYVQGAPDNRGTEFVIGYMTNVRLSNPVELFVTTSRTTTVYVQVTAPRFPSIGLNENFEVIAGMVKHLKFSNSIRAVGTALETKAVLVTASDEVVVYGVNMEAYSSDAFLAFPVDVIGKEYYAVSHYPSLTPCELMIIGVYDTTTVTIKYSSHYQVDVRYGGQTYGPGSTQTVVVNRFDTYQAQTMGDLTGSYLTADKNFVLMSGNQFTYVDPLSSAQNRGTRDTLVDQMLPVKTWGKEFALVPTPHRTTGDQVRFIAANDSTSVYLGCSGGYTRNFTVNAGGYKQYVTPSNQVCYCLADKPLMVIVIVVSQLASNEPADPALITVPPMEQYAADYTFATPRYSQYPSSNYNSYFMFVVKESEKNNLTVDGSRFPSNTVYTTIPNTNYVGGFIPVSDGTHTVRHDSPISVFGGFMYGGARAESYGIPTGLRLAPINEVCVNSTSVVGDGVDNDCDGKIDEEICTGANGTDDDGDGLIDEDCAKPTPIHGNWGQWGTWESICYCLSGGTGRQPRRRTCTDPAPQYDGNQCAGSDTDYQSCTPTSSCPVDGGYTGWSQWSTCTITCGSGTITRTRTCTNPSTAHGGRNCSTIGVNTLSQPCHHSVSCPVIVIRDGGWSDWAAWTTCTKSCDTGRKVRVRYCNNPTPMNGLSCAGDALELGTCNTQSCSSSGSGGNGTSGGSGSSGSSLNGFSNNICPAQFFPCKSGSIVCVPLEFCCDCLSDCQDRSDEDVQWAQCAATLAATCGNTASGMAASLLLAVVAVFSALSTFSSD